MNETMPIITSTLQFDGTGFNVLDIIITKIVGFINMLIDKIMPEGGGGYLIVLVAILWAWLIKKKWQLNLFTAIFYVLVFFSFMRYFGVGG